MLKYADNVRARIADGIRRYSRIVGQARQRGMNEGDTGDIVKAMLSDMLGFDPFFDVTTESRARGPFADYAVQHDDALCFLLNVKALATAPNAAHLLRLSGAETPPYADWAVVSNAEVWACYRLGVGVDRHAELVFRVSLSDMKAFDEKVELFLLISSEGFHNHSLQHYWEQVCVMNPGRIGSLLLSEEVLSVIRRELQRRANYRVDRQALYEMLVREVIRDDALGLLRGENDAFPRRPECFAYVRDPNDPVSWRLPYRDADGSPNAEMLTLAVADMSRGFGGLDIPADDVALVKERLRDAYLQLGVSPDDLPEFLRRR